MLYVRSLPRFLLLLVCLLQCNYAKGEHSLVQPFTTKGPSSVPNFVLDLDLPPKQRWKHIVKNYNGQKMAKEVNQILIQLLGSKTLSDYIIKIAADVEKYIRQPYADELRGISEILDIDLGVIVIINVLYDSVAYSATPLAASAKACTSIVSMNSDGHIIHGRNLDFDFGGFLRNFVINVDYQRGGKTVYVGTHFAGMIGLVTGAKPGAFTLSLNERDTGFLWENLLAALERSSITFFFFRDVLETAQNYNDALYMLRNANTVAPAYFVVGGVKPLEGAVVVGDRWGSVMVASMNDSLEHKWFVVETNYEPWKKAPASDDRRDAAIKSMLAVGQDKMNVLNLYKVLSTQPVLNPSTVFTTVMSARNASVYHTTVRNLKPMP